MQYSWRPIDLLSNSSISNPIGVVSLPALFYVSVTNEEGCESVDSVFVDVKKIIVNCEEESLFLPNSFSPNGDGINDKLYIRTEELFENVILRVFNRWGELVFETNDQKIGWDGRYKGFDAIGDSFAYYFEGICASKEKIVKKGNITIIR
ncbi:MAG: gliding motility-associated C-terminal domain-containing protein [Bacteroidetes bacterium]|nr:gliding motility-associated C-terminal domain-containing protein [Bacteroidota bacterium]